MYACVSVYIYVCMCVCMCVCKHLCMHVYLCIYVCMCVCMCVCKQTCVKFNTIVRQNSNDYIEKLISKCSTVLFSFELKQLDMCSVEESIVLWSRSASSRSPPTERTRRAPRWRA